MLKSNIIYFYNYKLILNLKQIQPGHFEKWCIEDPDE
mgnify:CR=1 FL=1|jgi:hypothetical protein